ncbi:hypothetical protein KP509_12G093700 [Ceratopteris richardii]|nr:hypothetical protein KP509_12G093700 [Ceratopteris richardii]
MGVDIMGTIGYCAPECFEGRISTKSDIFSLGILLVELISGKRPSDECSQQRGLAVWAWQQAINSVKCQEKVTGQGPPKFSSFIDRMVDPKLGECSSLRELQCLICIGLLCIHPLESYRPSINEVLNLICKKQASILYRMVIEKYHEAWYPAFSIMDRCRFTRTRDDDQMKKHIEIAMADMEEHSSLLHNHNLSL